jgi:hypothetical protein
MPAEIEDIRATAADPITNSADQVDMGEYAPKIE